MTTIAATRKFAEAATDAQQRTQLIAALVRMGDAAAQMAADARYEPEEFADFRRHATSIASRAAQYEKTSDAAMLLGLDSAVERFERYAQQQRVTPGAGNVIGAVNQLLQKTEAYSAARELSAVTERY